MREKFAVQIDSEILAALRRLAQNEGRTLQAVLDEAFANVLEKRKNGHVRSHVMSAYSQSRGKYGSFYKKLAE
jgi:hypothetical protein